MVKCPPTPVFPKAPSMPLQNGDRFWVLPGLRLAPQQLGGLSLAGPDWGSSSLSMTGV